MTSQLEEQVAHYHEWRDVMAVGIQSYKEWLDSNSQADIQQSLRIHDLIESLRNDRITLAFLAEFSRGKTELINAMFFSDFEQRLLPSNIGRTTMCPTEIFHDPTDGPYLRLLPIETRKREETIAALKRQAVEWIKIKLNVDSRQDMKEAMPHLAEVKTVSIDEAKSLGLWDDSKVDATTMVIKDGDRVDIPAWRHAIISYPHPLLKQGLVVLDTPGLNALGTEPELTFSMIPNAHAVMFLLAIDTGVTRSDLEVWQKYVIPSGARSIAVLNKIDLMWDDMKSTADIARDIERQVEQTAALLALPRTQVMAISAQKALLARILGDAGLIAKSGIYQLEQLLASEIIPAKRAILRDAVQREIGGMVEASRATVANQLVAALTELKQFTSLSGKNRNMVQAMVKRLEADQAGYRTAVQTFRTSSNAVVGRGDELLKQLDAAAIERILNKDREFIEGAWTTAGLWKSIQILIQYFTTVSSKMLNVSNQITRLVDMTYVHFHESFGFAKLSPLHLNLEKHSLSMASLRETVKQFCHDPVNVAKYKDFVVDRFYEVLVGQARQIFEATRVDVETWLKGALKPLDMQIKSHEQVLAKRIENLKKIRDNLGSIEERIKGLGKERDKLQQQSKLLARIRFSLDDKPSVKQTRAAL